MLSSSPLMFYKINKEILPKDDDACHSMPLFKVYDPSENGVTDFTPYCNPDVPNLPRLHALNWFSSEIWKIK